MEIKHAFLSLKWYLVFFAITIAVVTGLLQIYHWYQQDGGYFFLSMQTPITIPKDKIKKVVLKNGMTVMIFEDHSEPKVLVQIAYDIGSAVEAAGERGLAHLIEHMIFKGTEKLSESDIDAIARKYGATFNAFTSMDVTSYFFETDKNNWKPFLPILADCMVNARFDAQHLASEVKAVIQELRMYRDNYWHVMIEKAQELLFPPDHPYHTPEIGFKSDLAALSADVLQKFYRKYYHPKHATLFIIGDVDPDEVVSQVSKHFASIAGGQLFELPVVPDVISDVLTQKTIMYRAVSSPQLGFYWRMPGLKDASEIEAQAVEFVLGEGEGSRLYKRLVDEEKVATALQVGAEHLQDAGTFLILIQPKEGQLERCRLLVKEELNTLINEGITRRELSKLVRFKKRTFFELMEDHQAFAYEWLTHYFATGNELSFFERLNKLTALSSGQIAEFTKKFLDPFFMNEIQLLPIPQEQQERLVAARQADDALDLRILSKHIRTAPIQEPKYVATLPPKTPIDAAFPKPDRVFVLDNGLKVLLRNNLAWPLVVGTVQFRDAHFLNGAKEGVLVNLMMDMLTEASKGLSKQQVVAGFEDEGAGYSFGATGGSFSSLKEAATHVLSHFYHVLTQPDFNGEALKKLQAISVDHFERMQDDPMQVASRIFRNLVYPNHPFFWSFEDAIALLKKVQIRELQMLHKKYVSPSSMVLSLSGDFDLNTMQAKISEIFSTWKGNTYQPVTPKKMTEAPAKTIDYYMLRDQAVLTIGRPSSLDIYHPDLVPLKLLNFVCWHSLGSRLYQLRERTGLFYVARGEWAANVGKEHGFDYISAILNVDNLFSTQEKLHDIITEISQKGISQEELEVARALYTKSILDLRDSNLRIARTFCGLESFGLGFDYYDKVLTRIQDMKLDEINAIAKKYFSTKNLHTIRVGRVKGQRRRRLR